MVLEINSAGLRKPIKEQYPSRLLLEEAFSVGIDITLSSDAHSVEQVGFEYDRVYSLVQDIGYSKITAFKGREREIYML